MTAPLTEATALSSSVTSYRDGEGAPTRLAVSSILLKAPLLANARAASVLQNTDKKCSETGLRPDPGQNQAVAFL